MKGRSHRWISTPEQCTQARPAVSNPPAALVSGGYRQGIPATRFRVPFNLRPQTIRDAAGDLRRGLVGNRKYRSRH